MMNVFSAALEIEYADRVTAGTKARWVLVLLLSDKTLLHAGLFKCLQNKARWSLALQERNKSYRKIGYTCEVNVNL
jgi:hypothetical protein